MDPTLTAYLHAIGGRPNKGAGPSPSGTSIKIAILHHSAILRLIGSGAHPGVTTQGVSVKAILRVTKTPENATLTVTHAVATELIVTHNVTDTPGVEGSLVRMHTPGVKKG